LLNQEPSTRTASRPIADASHQQAHNKAAAHTKAILAAVEKDVLGGTARSQWAFLEASVVYDEILYDGFAFPRFPLRDKNRDNVHALEKSGLRSCEWPVSVYESTYDRVVEWGRTLKERGLAAITSITSHRSTSPLT